MPNELIPLEGPKVVAQPTNPYLYQEGRVIFPEPAVAISQGIDLAQIGKAAAELGTQYVQLKQEEFFSEKQTAVEKTTQVAQSKLAHYMKMNDIDNYTKTVEQYKKDVGTVMGIDPTSTKAPAGLAWQRMWTATKVSLGKFETDRESLVIGAEEDRSVSALRTVASKFDYDIANAKTVDEAKALTEQYQQALVTLNKTELQGSDDVFAEDNRVLSPSQFQRKALIQSEYAKAQAQLQKAVDGQKGFDPKNIWNRGQAQLNAAHAYLDLAEKGNNAILAQAQAGLETNPAQVTAVGANIVKLTQASTAAVSQVLEALRASSTISEDQYKAAIDNKSLWLTPEGVAMLQVFGADDPFIEKLNKTVVFLGSNFDEQITRSAKTFKAVSENTEKARNAQFEGATSLTINGVVGFETQHRRGEISLLDAQTKATALAERHRQDLLTKFDQRWGAKLKDRGINIASIDFSSIDEVQQVVSVIQAISPDSAPLMSNEIAKIADQLTKVNEKVQQLYPADSNGAGKTTGGVTREQGGRQLLNAAQTGSTTVTKDDFANASYAVDAAFKDMGFSVSVEPDSLPVAAQMYDFLKKNPEVATKLPYDLLMSSKYGPALIQAALAEYDRTATESTTETREQFFGKFLKRFITGSGDSPLGWGDMHKQEGVSFAIDIPDTTADSFMDMLREPSNDQATMTAAMSLGTSKWREGLAARVHAKANTDPNISIERKNELHQFAARLAEYDSATHGDPFRASTETPVLLPRDQSILDAIGSLVASGSDDKQFDDQVAMFQDPTKQAAVSFAKYVRKAMPGILAGVENAVLDVDMEDPVFSKLVMKEVSDRFKDYMKVVAANPTRFTALLGEASTVDRDAVLKDFKEHLKVHYDYDSPRKQFVPARWDHRMAQLTAPDRSSVASSGVMHSTDSTESIALRQPLVFSEKNAASFFAQFGPIDEKMTKPQKDGTTVLQNMMTAMDNNPMAVAVRLGLAPQPGTNMTGLALGVAREMNVTTAGGVLAAQMAINESKQGLNEPLESFVSRVAARGQELHRSILDNSGGLVNVETLPFVYTNGSAKAVTIRPMGLEGRPSATYFLTDGTNRGDIRQTPEYIESQAKMPYSVFLKNFEEATTDSQRYERIVDWMLTRPEVETDIILYKDSDRETTVKLTKRVNKDGETVIEYKNMRRELTAARFFGLNTDPSAQRWEVDQKWMGGPLDITVLYKGPPHPKPKAAPLPMKEEVASYSLGGVDMNADNYVTLLPAVLEGVFSPNMPEDRKVETWKNLLTDLPTLSSEEAKRNVLRQMQTMIRYTQDNGNYSSNVFPSELDRMLSVPLPTKANPLEYSVRENEVAAEEARQWEKVGTGRRFDFGSSLMRDIPPFFTPTEEPPISLLGLGDVMESLNALKYPTATDYKTYNDKKRAAEKANLDNVKMLRIAEQAVNDSSFAAYIKKYLGL